MFTASCPNSEIDLTKLISRKKGIAPSDIDIAERACRRIKLLVMTAFICWTLYYLITGLALIHNQGSNTLFDRTVLATFNTIPSVALFWPYIELAKFTVDQPDSYRPRGISDSNEVAELVSSDAAEFTRLISLGVFALTIAPMWVTCGWENEHIIAGYEIATSCMNGVCLALVVGRLDSKIIDAGSLPIGLLYFYAVIQPAAATFHNGTTEHLLATTIALPLKVLFWLVFVWAFTTGVISEYVHTIRVLLTRGYTEKYSGLE